jgi:hypothetical protein
VAARERDTVRVTSAGLSHTDDLRLRQRRYLITQAVRVSCVLLAVLLPVAVPWKIGFIVGAVVLPWFGVVAANAGPTVERRRPVNTLLAAPTDTPALLAIEPGRVIDPD